MIGLYFSGTGNTRWCVSYFINRLGGNSVYSIECIDKNIIRENKEIVLAYPVYYSNLPKIVRDFIMDNRELWHGKKIYIIASMGLFSGDGAGVSARLLKKFGAQILGGLHIKMPDCIGDVKALKKTHAENAAIIENAEQKLNRAAQLYLNGNYTRDGLNFLYHLAGLFGQRLYFYGKTKNYTKNPKINADKCIGCGKCEQLCPLCNIRIVNGRAVSGERCTMCYRCFVNCPEKAITVIGKQVIEQHKIENYIDTE